MSLIARERNKKRASVSPGSFLTSHLFYIIAFRSTLNAWLRTSLQSRNKTPNIFKLLYN